MRSILRSIYKYLALASALTWTSRFDVYAMLVFHDEIDEAIPRNSPLTRAISPLDSGAGTFFAEHLRSNLTAIIAPKGSRILFEPLSAGPARRTGAIRVIGEGSLFLERPQNHHSPAPGPIQRTRNFRDDVAEPVRKNNRTCFWGMAPRAERARLALSADGPWARNSQHPSMQLKAPP